MWLWRRSIIKFTTTTSAVIVVVVVVILEIIIIALTVILLRGIDHTIWIFTRSHLILHLSELNRLVTAFNFATTGVSTLFVLALELGVVIWWLVIESKCWWVMIYLLLLLINSRLYLSILLIIIIVNQLLNRWPSLIIIIYHLRLIQNTWLNR